MANLLSDEPTVNSIMTKVIIHVLNVQESIGLDGFQKDSKTSLFGPNGETDKILAKEKMNFDQASKGHVLAHIRSIFFTFQSPGRGYMKSWNFVPPEKKDQWWHAFIQHYYWEDQFHDEIYLKWKKQTQVTVCGRISQKMRDNRQPSYMSDAHWATMVEKYNTEKAKKKSAKAAKSRKSAPVGKKMHKHGAGPRCFLNIEYNMMVDEGLDEPPSYTALARKTHTGKDGSFLDERTEELVLEVEEAVEEMLQDGSPLGDGQTDSTAASNVKRYLLNQEYIKRGKTKKGTIYGLGSVQYKNSSASVLIHVSLKRNLDVDMRMSGFETTISEVKEDIAGVKEDFTALKTEINAFKTEVTGDVSKPSNSQHYSANCPISSFHSCLNCTTISASTSVTTSRSAPSSSSISTSATTLSSVYASTTTSLDQYPF
ncbi:hypothetical protein Bca101_006237 [Brassica carinata]